ncbi:H-2 class I histocompatibility antigen, Q10 alpha chain-like isoform X2 [Pristis pectinata]|uniref:H-2 class I histocompatibility antigen, Q10 alpha chain-like isoform X2 n=1 Tax=Pristis pectinata TaxID=685728 RepID=UPI00223DB429|nr:H-2 class I histocompatibility antigen, Q10 alpha chain-like isoform X2 [Pristis pectinata]
MLALLGALGWRMLLILCVLCLSIRWVCAETHSLQYFYTSMAGNVDFPEFVHVGLLDDVQITYFDSNIENDISRQPWMDRELDGDYWKKETQRLINRHKLSMANLQIAIQRTNISRTRLNYLQYTSGCRVSDDGMVSGVRQYAFNGQDLISFDLEHSTWVTTSPIALETRDKWNRDNANNLYKKHYTEKICVEWLRKYLKYGAQTLSRRAVPEVLVYSRKTPDGQNLALHCLATGFYPRTINVTWFRDGQPLPPHASSSILPNHDNTYQIKVSLLLEPGERREHACHVQHSSVPEGVTVVWDQYGVAVSWIVGIVLIIGIVLVAVIALMYRRERMKCTACLSKGSTGTNSPLSDSDSDQPWQKIATEGQDSKGEKDKMLV